MTSRGRTPGRGQSEGGGVSGVVSVFGIPARTARCSGTPARFSAPAAVSSAGCRGPLRCPPGPGLLRFPRQSFAPKDFVSSSALFVALQTGLSTASDSSGSCISSPAIAVHNPARSQHPVSVRPGKPSLTSLMHPFQWCNGESRVWRVSGHLSGPGPEPSFAVPERSWRPAVLCTARSLKRPILSIWG